MNIHIVHSQLLLSAIILALGIADARIEDNSNCSNNSSLLAVSNVANQFNNKFFKNLAVNELSNFVCSPIGLNILLSMITFGARGTTKKQLESLLSLPQDENLTKQGYQQLIDLLNNITRAELRLADKLFTTNECDVLPEFDKILKTYFRSEIQKVDFTKPEEAAITINNWCANKTDNHISKLFEANNLEDAKLVLVNAIYFKGTWEYPFDIELTKNEIFFIDDNKSVYVPMMYSSGKYSSGSISELNATFIKLPYQSNNDDEALSMYIISPNDNNGLKNIKNNFDKINFAHLNNLKSDFVLILPKFRIKSEFDLKPTLKKMGINEIFEINANFRGINDQKSLAVDKIVQKAIIEVNEIGSEAAALTGATISLRDSFEDYYSEPVLYRVDSPFVYSIVHESTNTVLFQGHVYDPNESEK